MNDSETDFEYLAVVRILVEYTLQLSDKCWKDKTFIEVIYNSKFTFAMSHHASVAYSVITNYYSYGMVIN